MRPLRTGVDECRACEASGARMAAIPAAELAINVRRVMLIVEPLLQYRRR